MLWQLITRAFINLYKKYNPHLIFMYLELKNVLESMMSFGEGGWSCTTCGKTMHSKKDMRRHCETHVNVTHECQECYKIFKTSNALRQHHSVHHKAQTMF